MKTYLIIGFLTASFAPGHAGTTINAANRFAYGANIGWTDCQGDASDGAVIGEYICSGSIYSANLGWISLGDGMPADGIYYQNTSASDFGVNHDGAGNLRGLAYGANVGWIKFGDIGVPSARFGHKAVWTGSEMIIWGGDDYSSLIFNTGGRYDPVANSWTAMSTSGAPGARYEHTAVWTGSELVVWGGYSGGVLNDGGRYDPVANSWTAVSTTGAPSARAGHTAVWTGSEMIVWGGATSTATSTFNDGGRYDPLANSWTAVSTIGAPAGRFYHTAIWTGSEMIVWGGAAGTSYFNDGGRYDPIADSWTPVGAAEEPRELHTAVWTGHEMIVWGGSDASSYFNDGGRYDPVGNSWTAVSPIGAPSGRFGHTAVWTGSEMIIWGGIDYNGPDLHGLDSGGRYDPVANSWTAVSRSGAPLARGIHTAVWTGSEMIVWGGNDYSSDFLRALDDGGRYNPTADRWRAVTTTGAPTVDLKAGNLSGYAWSANCGWISLSNTYAHVQTDTIAPGADTDGDGIPDAFELTSAGSLDVFTATTDSDGDGISDRDEYLADTDPLDPDDYLRILSITRGTPTPTYTTLLWTSKPTRCYAVQDRHALEAGSPWVDLGVLPFPGADNAGFDESDDQHFYRIRAFRPLAP